MSSVTKSQLLSVSRKNILLTLEFSATAIRIDEFASSFADDSIIKLILHNGARIVSLLTPHVLVEVSVYNSNEEEDETAIMMTRYQQDYNILAEITLAVHRRLLLGYSMNVEVPTATLLIWNFTGNSFMNVMSSMKKKHPTCRALTMEQIINIPMAYAIYKKTSYSPPPDLLTVKST